VLKDTPLCIRMFGQFEARLRGEVLPQLRARDGEKLLAYLVLKQGRRIQNSTIADVFWPETGSLDSLRHSISNLRRALGDESHRLEISKGSVSLNLEGTDVDLLRFLKNIQADDTSILCQALLSADEPLLSGWTESWVEEERRRLARKQVDALRRASDEAMKAGMYAEAVTLLRRLVRALPSEQRWWINLMKALIGYGEVVEALQHYQRYREYLVKFNLLPPSEMTALVYDLQAHIPRDPVPPTISEAPLTPEPVGGAVPLHSRFYVTRPEDDKLREALLRGDSVVLIKGPRETGKSSLLARGLHEARRAGSRVITTDLSILQEEDTRTLDSICLRLAGMIAAQLELPLPSEPEWKRGLPPGMNFERFMLRSVLGTSTVPIIWAIDEVDRLFERVYSPEFFAMLRSWHEKRSFDPSRPWHRLSVALACATEAHLFIRNLDQSPFNVGTHLLLGDFTFAQVKDLNMRQGSPLKPEGCAAFFDLVGGHPYLVRQGLNEITTHGYDVAELAGLSDQDGGPFGRHLRRMVRLVSGDPDLRAALISLLNEKPCDETSFLRLRSAGVVTGCALHLAQLRCRLYASYLHRRLQ
jgi:DNA-binding SARP family transcriptional activator